MRVIGAPSSPLSLSLRLATPALSLLCLRPPRQQIQPAGGEGAPGVDGVDVAGEGDGGASVGRARSLIDDDLEELKGCMDLGFGFSYDEFPEQCGTLPMLELCYSMSQRFLDEHQSPPPRSSEKKASPEAEPTLMAPASPAQPIPNWKISSSNGLELGGDGLHRKILRDETVLRLKQIGKNVILDCWCALRSMEGWHPKAFDIKGSNTSAGAGGGFGGMVGLSDWELALAGGFDKLLLDSLYDDAARRQQEATQVDHPRFNTTDQCLYVDDGSTATIFPTEEQQQQMMLGMPQQFQPQYAGVP